MDRSDRGIVHRGIDISDDRLCHRRSPPLSISMTTNVLAVGSSILIARITSRAIIRTSCPMRAVRLDPSASEPCVHRHRMRYEPSIELPGTSFFLDSRPVQPEWRLRHAAVPANFGRLPSRYDLAAA